MVTLDQLVWFLAAGLCSILAWALSTLISQYKESFKDMQDQSSEICKRVNELEDWKADTKIKLHHHANEINNIQQALHIERRKKGE